MEDTGYMALLKKTANRFSALHQEAAAFHCKGELGNQEQTLRERAELLVDLPAQVRPLLSGKSEWGLIAFKLQVFAVTAEQALKSEEQAICRLDTLLTCPELGAVQKNDLEQLIERLERVA